MTGISGSGLLERKSWVGLWSWTTVVVLILALTSAGMLLLTRRISERHVVRDSPIAVAVADLRVRVASSHLWLEEYLTLDATVDIQKQVWNEIAEARSRTYALLNGGQMSLGQVEISPLTEPAMRSRVREIQGLLRIFEDLARERVEKEAGIGTELDQEYDRTFGELIHGAEVLEDMVQAEMVRNQGRSSFFYGAIVVSWVVLIGLALTTLAQRERRRRDAEVALRHSEERLATTLRSIGDAVITTDPDGCITFMNTVAEELTGWKQVEAIGESLAEVFRVYLSEGGEPRRHLQDRILESGGVYAARDHVLERRDGMAQPIDETASPIRGQDGADAGVVVVFRDVTERKQAELALRESEAQLRQSQKLEAVGRLAGGLAHDINNYLAAITTQCELVKILHEGNADIAEKMDTVIDSSAKTSSLIRRLLAFSRKQPIKLQVVDLNQITEGLEKMMRRLIGEDIRLEIQLAEGLWCVKVDPSQVEQILVNLLVNAREAMPEGGRLVVETSNITVQPDEARETVDAEPGEFVLLSVSDTGTGIPEEIRERIFEPFFSTKGESGSTGLGLSTVYGIVRQGGGFIRVESVEGEGTVFGIFLPRTHEEATAVLRASDPTVGDIRRSCNLLLVEDNQHLRQSIREVLTALGHRVTDAEDGAQALELFCGPREPFDLIISDMLMPGLNGKDLVEKVWQLQPDIRVIFISGYMDRMTVQDLVTEGRAGFLQKPFSAAALVKEIEEVMVAPRKKPGHSKNRDVATSR